MAREFNLTARINATGVFGLRPVVDRLRRDLNNIRANVDVRIDPGATGRINQLNQSLASLETRLRSISSLSASTRNNLNSLGGAFSNAGAQAQRQSRSQANVNTVLARTSRGAAEAAGEMEEFGRVSGLAIRRFAGFSAVTGVVFGFINATARATKEAISFERELARVAQVSGTGLNGLSGLTNEITRLSTKLGISSSSLLTASRTLKQAGFTASEVKNSLESLAQTELAPTFDSITTTTEGAIAVMRQFNLEAKDLGSVLGSINKVAGQFAVESGDIIAAIRRAGGVFAAATGDDQDARQSVRQFIALFTSVRATTRETAESIAVGLRTVFSRLQRRGTIEALRNLGIELETVEGQFVGPFKAVELLNKELSKLKTTDTDFAAIVEELGGIRQIGKIIPLITKFGEAEKALAVAVKGQESLAEDAAIAQQTLAVRFTKTREKFLALVRDVTQSNTFQLLAGSALKFADSLIAVGDAVTPLVPLLTTLAAIKGAQVFGQFSTGFRRGVSAGGQNPRGSSSVARTAADNRNTAAVNQNTAAQQNQTVTQRASANANASIVSALSAVQAALSINTAALGRLAGVLSTARFRRNRGGPIGFQSGGVVPGSGRGDKIPAMLEPGEGILNRAAMSKLGAENLQKLNGGGSTGFRPQLTVRSRGKADVGRKKQFLFQKLDFLVEKGKAGIITPQEEKELQTITARLKNIQSRRTQRFSARFGLQEGGVADVRRQLEALLQESKSTRTAFQSNFDPKTGFSPNEPGFVNAGTRDKPIGSLIRFGVKGRKGGQDKLTRSGIRTKIGRADKVLPTFGAAFLRPSDFTSRTSGVIDASVIGADAPAKFKLISGSLRSSFSNEIQDSMLTGIINSIKLGASTLGKTVGSPGTQPITGAFLKKFNIDQIIGNVFEAILNQVNPKFESKATANASFDFPSGITSGMANAFTYGKLLQRLPVDAKATASTEAFESIIKKVRDVYNTTAGTIGRSIKPRIQPKSRQRDSGSSGGGGALGNILGSLDRQGRGMGGGVRRRRLASGGVPVALTPGELVFGPDATLQAGISNLERFNKSGNPFAIDKINSGVGVVPGSGNTDSFNTTLPSGSFVVRKSSSEAITKAGRGGHMRKRFGSGGGVGIRQHLQVGGTATTATARLDKILEAVEVRLQKFTNSSEEVVTGLNRAKKELQRGATAASSLKSAKSQIEDERRQIKAQVAKRAANAPGINAANVKLGSKLIQPGGTSGANPQQLAKIRSRLIVEMEEQIRELKSTKGNRKKAAQQQRILTRSLKQFDQAILQGTNVTKAYNQALNKSTKRFSIQPGFLSRGFSVGSPLKKVGKRLSGAASGGGLSIAAFTAAPLIQDAIGTDTPGAAATGSAVSGGFIGATTGGLVGGPIGAVIGGVIGAFGSFRSTLEEENGKLLDVKISNALKNFEKELELFSADKLDTKGLLSSINSIGVLSGESVSTGFAKRAEESFFTVFKGIFDSNTDESQRQKINEQIGERLTTLGEVGKQAADVGIERGAIRTTEDIDFLGPGFLAGIGATNKLAREAALSLNDEAAAKGFLIREGQRLISEDLKRKNEEIAIAEGIGKLTREISLLELRITGIGRAASLAVTAGDSFRDTIDSLVNGFGTLQTIKVPDFSDIDLISQEEFNTRRNQITSSFGGNALGGEFGDLLDSVRTLRTQGPQVAASIVGKSGTDADALSTVVRKELERLEIAEPLQKAFQKQILELFSGSRQGFAQPIEKLQDPQKVIDAITTTLGEEVLKSFSELAKATETVTNEFLKNFNAYSKVLVDSANKGNQVADLQVEQSLKLQESLGRIISVGDVFGSLQQRVSDRTGGITSPEDIANTILQARDRDRSLRAETSRIIESGDLSALQANQDAIAKNTVQGKQLESALELLATDVSALSKVQSKLAELQQQREKGRSLLERTARASVDPKEARELNRDIFAAQTLLSGRGGVNADVITRGATFLREQGGIFGREDFVNQLLDRRFAQIIGGPGGQGFGNAFGFANTLVGRQGQEQVLIGQFQFLANLQQQAINEQKNLVDTSAAAIRESANQILQAQQARFQEFLKSVGEINLDATVINDKITKELDKRTKDTLSDVAGEREKAAAAEVERLAKIADSFGDLEGSFRAREDGVKALDRASKALDEGFIPALGRAAQALDDFSKSDFFNNLLDNLQFTGDSPAILNPFDPNFFSRSNLLGIDTRANGGPLKRNGMYLVGEKGPELITGASGHVVPNKESMMMIDGAFQNGTRGGLGALRNANFGIGLDPITRDAKELVDPLFKRIEDFILNTVVLKGFELDSRKREKDSILDFIGNELRLRSKITDKILDRLPSSSGFGSKEDRQAFDELTRVGGVAFREDGSKIELPKGIIQKAQDAIAASQATLRDNTRRVRGNIPFSRRSGEIAVGAFNSPEAEALRNPDPLFGIMQAGIRQAQELQSAKLLQGQIEDFDKRTRGQFVPLDFEPLEEKIARFDRETRRQAIPRAFDEPVIGSNTEELFADLHRQLKSGAINVGRSQEADLLRELKEQKRAVLDTNRIAYEQRKAEREQRRREAGGFLPRSERLAGRSTNVVPRQAVSRQEAGAEQQVQTKIAESKITDKPIKIDNVDQLVSVDAVSAMNRLADALNKFNVVAVTLSDSLDAIPSGGSIVKAGYARGGFVRGPYAGAGIDNIHAMMQPGEFVVRRSVAQQPGMGSFLQGLNNGGTVEELDEIRRIMAGTQRLNEHLDRIQAEGFRINPNDPAVRERRSIRGNVRNNIQALNESIARSLDPNVQPTKKATIETFGSTRRSGSALVPLPEPEFKTADERALDLLVPEQNRRIQQQDRELRQRLADRRKEIFSNPLFKAQRERRQNRAAEARAGGGGGFGALLGAAAGFLGGFGIGPGAAAGRAIGAAAGARGGAGGAGGRGGARAALLRRNAIRARGRGLGGDPRGRFAGTSGFRRPNPFIGVPGPFTGFVGGYRGINRFGDFRGYGVPDHRNFGGYRGVNPFGYRGVSPFGYFRTPFGFANGGEVPAMLQSGEYVVNRFAAQRNMPLLNAINGRGRRFHSGGAVQRLQGGGPIHSGSGLSGLIPQQAISSMYDLSTSLTGFNTNAADLSRAINSLGDFASIASSLTRAAEGLKNINVPDSVQITVAPIQVNATVSAPDINSELSRIKSEFENIIAKQIKAAVDKNFNITGEPTSSFGSPG